MNRKLSRRDFLKFAALAAGGATAVGIGLPLAIGEEAAIFDPNDSYWAKEQPAPNPALAEKINVDVAIIGGGYTGLSAAWHLAQITPKLDIVVLEARQVGHGASGRHGGMVLPQTGAESFEIAHDEETHKWTYDLTVASMRALQKLVASTGIDCDLKLDGYCHAILSEEDLPDYARYVDQAQALGIPLELYDQKSVAQELGTAFYCGAVYDPNGGQVHAIKLIKALKRAAENSGVRIFESSPVTRIEEGKELRLTVGATHQQVRAKAIVLATNGYTAKLGYFKHQVMPVHTQCAVTPPLSQTQLNALGWNSRLPFFDSRNLLYHVILTADQRILIGGGNAEYLFRNNLHYGGSLDGIANMMRNELIRLYPSLRDIHFENVWNGILGVTFDQNEAVGVMGEYRNIYYGLAYNGHGVNLSFLFGDVIASLYQRREHSWQHTAYPNHTLPWIPPDPYRWIGVQAMMQYYRWLDGQSA